MYPERLVSGMRPTDKLHLGHYYSVLQEWRRLQSEQSCLFFIADWHALGGEVEACARMEKHTRDMLLDWLAAGIDPTQATLFIQSEVPEHAELQLLLAMATPANWLDLSEAAQDGSFANLAYVLLQAADALIYRASHVAMYENQSAQLEMMREIARRFNHLFGSEKDFEEKAESAVKKLGSKRARLYAELRTAYQQEGRAGALEQAKAMLDEAQNLSMIDRERLFGYLEGSRKLILVEPEVSLLPQSSLPGLDGQRMQSRQANVICLREDAANVERKVRAMPTDPARVSRSDPGAPDKCPVWPLHQAFSPQQQCGDVRAGCMRAVIGCVDCKQQLAANIIAAQAPLHEAVQTYLDDPSLLRAITADGAEHARKLARETLRDVREAMGLQYQFAGAPL
ncbi:tryptophan--tRNA ligase [Massilia sp. W12]|uniref:tryptophan--tRNA ligase n=1 Tax=Massilia sp. W12 TaxID=3126507 RepID=UPI0030D1A4D1